MKHQEKRRTHLNDKNQKQRPQYIVTLTSYGHRVEQSAPYAICSLLNQSVSPDKVILWLAYNTPVPPVLEKLSKVGLEIKFCEDLKSYKKLIPALIEFRDDILITADDDVFYPKHWFAQLKNAFLLDPSKIYAHRVHEIGIDTQGNILPYRKWSTCITSTNDEGKIFPTGVGGILYPPNSLHPLCTDIKSFTSIAPTGDDIWFWATAKLNGTKHSIIKNGYKDVKSIDPKDPGLWIQNINYGGNDKQLENVIKWFPEIKKIVSKFRPRDHCIG